jgi:UDP-N-acetylmuramyl tripeptide synthase
VLVLGKGHEVGQEISGNKTPFDDRIQLKTAILNKLKGETK